MLKKLVAGVLSLAMFTIPAASMAIQTVERSVPAITVSTNTASSDEELTAAIMIFKNIFGSTDNYDSFNHYINNYNGVKVYQLQWSDTVNGDTIYASVGIDGLIYSYDYYNYNESYNSRLPKIFKDDALKIAYEFVKKVSPDVLGSISTDYTEISLSSYQSKYTVTFYRITNGYLVNNETINVTIDQDKKITNYARNNYSVNVSNPSAPKLTDIGSIKKVLNNNLPFELAYRAVYTNEYSGKAEIKLVYVVNSLASDYVVNAESGAILETKYQSTYTSPQVKNEELAVAESAPRTGADYSLTDVESKAVEMQKSFMTADEVTARLLGMREIYFNANYFISGSRLYSSESVYTDKITYYWDISYRNDNEKDKYVSVTVNAETGEIKSFYSYDDIIQPLSTSPENTGYVSKLNYAIEQTEKFLEKYYPNIYKEYRLESERENEQTSSNYYIEYVRYVNDIPTRDRISFNLKLDTFEVTSVNVTHSDATFPSPDKAITSDKAMEKYIELYGLDPVYIPYINGDGISVLLPSEKLSNTEKKLMLIYSINNNGSYIDAFTGKIIDSYNGKDVEYTSRKYYTSSAFTDIKGHKYEKEINILSQMDIIATDKEKYDPDTYITKSDYEKLLESVNGGYSVYRETSSSIAAGNLVTAKNDSITREKAITDLITKMGYDEIAKLPNIFNVDYFTDANTISKSAMGYIALAKGMGLLETFGTKLSPQSKLTRGEAAYLIYSYFVYDAE